MYIYIQGDQRVSDIVKNPTLINMFKRFYYPLSLNTYLFELFKYYNAVMLQEI